MAYTQTNNPFAKTSCGRRYGPLKLTNNDTTKSPFKKKQSPFLELRAIFFETLNSELAN